MTNELSVVPLWRALSRRTAPALLRIGGFALVALAACSSAPAEPEPSSRGDEGDLCDEGRCFDGLSCVSERCVRLPSGADAGPEARADAGATDADAAPTDGGTAPGDAGMVQPPPPAPTRVLFVFTPHGSTPIVRPGETPQDYQLQLAAELDRYRSRTTVLTNLRTIGTGQQNTYVPGTPGVVMTGRNREREANEQLAPGFAPVVGPSIDQLAGPMLRTPLPSLVVAGAGPQRQLDLTPLSFTAANEPIPSIVSPAATLERLLPLFVGDPALEDLAARAAPLADVVAEFPLLIGEQRLRHDHSCERVRGVGLRVAAEDVAAQLVEHDHRGEGRPRGTPPWHRLLRLELAEHPREAGPTPFVKGVARLPPPLLRLRRRETVLIELAEPKSKDLFRLDPCDRRHRPTMAGFGDRWLPRPADPAQRSLVRDPRDHL